MNYNSANGVEDLWLDWKGSVTEQTKQALIDVNTMLKPYRVKCFKVTVNFLETLGVPYFVTDGTLLAIYRDGGKMIPHDNDTDLAIREEHMFKVWQNRTLLPEPYALLTSDTGVEWCDENGAKAFDPTLKKGAKKFVVYDTRDYSKFLEPLGQYSSNVAKIISDDPRQVCTDMFTFRTATDDPNFIQNNWARANQGIEDIRYEVGKIFPCKRYTFEGVECWGPSEPEHYLTKTYGYLGRDACFNTDTKKYIKRM